MPLPLFLAPLALKLSPVGKIVKAIPWQGWVLLGVAFAVGWHLWGDKSRLRDARKAGDTAGYIRAMGEVEAKAKKIEQRSKDITEGIRNQNNAENRRIAGVADDLRVRGPGKARCNSPAVPASPGGHQPSVGGADASGTGLPVVSGNAAVPWDWLVGRAEKCDIDRAEAKSWREWHERLTKEWGTPVR